MSAIFLSHSSRDNRLLNEIKLSLEAGGYEQVFLDFDQQDGLRAGEDWERRLYAEIDRVLAIILIITPNWLASKWCFAEFTQARALGKLVVPILFPPFDQGGIAPEVQAIRMQEWNDEGRDRLLDRLREVVTEYAYGFKWDRSRCPYPGLSSFEQEDAALFFGRDAEIRELIERFEARRIQGGKRLLMIIGNSGSGKSSLLKAGVLPQIERRRRNWIALCPFRPQRDPLTSFAKSIAQHTDEPKEWRKWRDRLGGADPAATMGLIADELRIATREASTLLISIDQFEELFTISDPTTAGHFLNLLEAALDPKQQLPYLATGTVRTDVLNEILQSQRLNIPFDTYVLTGMSQELLSQVIDKPARIAGIGIDAGLSERIRADVSSSDALPLLSFTMQELYLGSSSERRLTVARYEALGDPSANLTPIENVVRRRAEDAIRAAEPTNTELATLKSAMIPGLVQIRDDRTFVRQRALLRNLPPAAHSLISALVEARLLSRQAIERQEDGKSETSVEVTHEALFHAWPQLKRWLEEEREFLLGKYRLAQALEEFKSAPGKVRKSCLLYGPTLLRIQHWVRSHPHGFSDEERAFIAASARQRKLRNAGVVVLVICTLLLTAGIVTPKLYSEYVQRTALECDLYAAEPFNDVHVPGIEFDRLIPDRAIPACRKAVATDPQNSRLLFNLGRSLDKAGAYGESVEQYEKATSLGSVSAQNGLGVLTVYGLGTVQDFGKGVALLRDAARQNNRDALLNYQKEDFSDLFRDSPERIKILKLALTRHMLLQGGGASDEWSSLEGALAIYKSSNGFDETGVTLRVLDNLEVIDTLGATFKQHAPLVTEAR